jgi:hypothetical protein
MVTTPPPGTITAGTPFGLTVEALQNNGNVDPNYSGVVTLTAIPGGSTFTATASHGVASFSGVVLNTTGSYAFQVTAPGLTSTTTSSINVTPSGSVPPTAPTITSAALDFFQKIKNGIPKGKRKLDGYQITFSTAMDMTALGNSNNYHVYTFAIKKMRVHGKTVKVTVTKSTPFTIKSVSSTGTSVILKIPPLKLKFPKGGQITVSTALDNTSGVFLAAPGGVLTISPGGKSIVVTTS